jgi:hypothetical protein
MDKVKNDDFLGHVACILNLASSRPGREIFRITERLLYYLSTELGAGGPISDLEMESLIKEQVLHRVDRIRSCFNLRFLQRWLFLENSNLCI